MLGRTMLSQNKKKFAFFATFCFLMPAAASSGEDDHDHHETETMKFSTKSEHLKEDHDNEGLIEISAEGQKAAGIETEVLMPRKLPIYLSAPGEVIPNIDKTSILTPRVQAQITQRIAKVGEDVKKGQALVRLSSVGMANAQAALLLADRELKRVESMGSKVVTKKRAQETKISHQQAYSKLLAYGMTKDQIDSFLKSDTPNKANGDFTLLSPRDGTIFSASFIEGQMVDPGDLLYKIVEEDQLWVDAKLSNGDAAKIQEGANATIQTTHFELPSKVLRVHHQLDETTRTRTVRLSVLNPKDQLHPSEFVTCLMEIGETEPVLGVHNTALMRTSDGDMVMYVEVKPNHFKARKLQVIKDIGPWKVIRGIQAGARVVTKGAFFVHSEALKDNFNAHNH